MKEQEIMLYVYEYIFELLFRMIKSTPIIKPRSIKEEPKHIRDVIRYQWLKREELRRNIDKTLCSHGNKNKVKGGLSPIM